MKVYVLETGRQGDRLVRGVYSSPENGRAAWHPVQPGAKPDVYSSSPLEHSYTWDVLEFDGWSDDAARLYELDLDAPALVEDYER